MKLIFWEMGQKFRGNFCTSIFLFYVSGFCGILDILQSLFDCPFTVFSKKD